jgi:hypothetical protein
VVGEGGLGARRIAEQRSRGGEAQERWSHDGPQLYRQGKDERRPESLLRSGHPMALEVSELKERYEAEG